LLRVKTYRLADRWLARLLNAVRATHRGLWLGLLDQENLLRATEMTYAAWDGYQAPDHNLSDLYVWEESALAQCYQDCRTLLVGAAGGGRELIALAQRGYQVDGFECTPEMVASSKALLAARGIEATIVAAPPSQVPEAFGIYDGLIMGWGGYMHIIGRHNRIRFLQQFRRHVHPGAPILLSFFARNTESRHFYWVRTVANIVRRLRLSQERVELGDDLERTFDHHFTEDEIATEIAGAGFEMIHFSARPYGYALGRAC